MNKSLVEFYKEIENIPLSKGNQAMVEKIARQIIKEEIESHTKICPNFIKWKLIAAVFLGAILGSGLGNGVQALAKFIIGL